MIKTGSGSGDVAIQWRDFEQCVLSRKEKLTSSAISTSEIATLVHEARDDTMEGGTLVMQRLATLSDTFFAG
jgi:hypothetical protein